MSVSTFLDIAHSLPQSFAVTEREGKAPNLTTVLGFVLRTGEVIWALLNHTNKSHILRPVVFQATLSPEQTA